MTSAYVSGMKEDLGMQGNQYNIAVSMWSVCLLVSNSGIASVFKGMAK